VSAAPPTLHRHGDTMKIAILGSHPASMKLAPFGDVNWEIWACSPQNFSAPRIDAWFELHSLDRKWVPGNEPYINVLQGHSRVYIATPDPRLPNGLIYPREEIKAKYPRMHWGNFSSSVAWMTALAIEQKPESIGFWGIDMAAGNEYEYQRPGVHYFMGVAEELGIKLVVPPQSDIMEVHPEYGFKEQWRSYWKMKARKAELTERLSGLDQKIGAATDEKLQLMGALQAMHYEENTWLKP
jgi:hypothetical protein